VYFASPVNVALVTTQYSKFIGYDCGIDIIYSSKYKLTVTVHLCGFIPTNLSILLNTLSKCGVLNECLCIHYQTYSLNLNTVLFPEKCGVSEILLNEYEFPKNCS